MHLDTSFVVDLLREGARGESGPAHRALTDFGDEPLAVCVFVACELHAGAELASEHERDRERAKVDAFLAALEVVHPNDQFAARYGEVLATLQRRGERIATMDLLIATAALSHGARLVTRNAREFDRVPELHVLGY